MPTKLEPWASTGPLRASINNFGYGGTNTHAIMEESPLIAATADDPVQVSSRQLFLISAHNKSTTQNMAANLRDYIESSKDQVSGPARFGNLAFTLAERRTRFPWTLAVSACSPEDLAAALGDGTVQPVRRNEKKPRLGFVFNGQGAQWFAMGRELSVFYPTYRETIAECDQVIRSFGSSWSLIEELGRSKEDSRVDQVEFSMPLSCAVQLALVKLLRSFGVVPAAVTGHSSGEIAAAFAAGALSLREALACTYYRGLATARYLDARAKQPAGGMLAVGLGSVEAQSYVDTTTTGKVVIACENSPSSVTLSGDMAGIEALDARFSSENIFARKLVVQSAFHSHHMLPLEKSYSEALRAHLTKERKFDQDVLFASPVTGTRVEDANDIGPEHWVRNMTSPVLFADSFRNMIVTEHPDGTTTQNVDLVVEIGPHSTLAGPVRQNLQNMPSLKGLSVAYGFCLERSRDAVLTIQTLAGLLACKGYPIVTSQVNALEGKSGLQLVPDLPSYPWNHNQRFWHESRISSDHRFRQHAYHDLLGVRITGTSDQFPIWRQIIRGDEVGLTMKCLCCVAPSCLWSLTIISFLGSVTMLCRAISYTLDQVILPWLSRQCANHILPLPLSSGTYLRKLSSCAQPSSLRAMKV